MADVQYLVADASTKKRLVDMNDGTHSERVLSHPPFDMLTDGGDGPNRRLRVDDGEADFFGGRKFRAYLGATIPVAGPFVQARFTCAVNFILTSQDLEITQGAITMQAFRGDVVPIMPSGTWTARPVIGVNRMTEIPQPPYVSQSSFEYGGDFTGGEEVELREVRTSAQNASAQNVVGKVTERGLPAGAYYFRFSTLTGGLVVNDSCRMIYSIEWMERP